MDISVIIPVYNSAGTVIESIDSVVSECVANPYSWELIVIDDGSKDNSVALIEDYIKASPVGENITLVRQANGGAAVARNTGLRLAQGEFIAFNDSDDRWLKGKIALQMEYMLKNRELDMIGCMYGKDNFQKGSFVHLQSSTRIKIQNQVCKNYFSPPTVMIRKEILAKSGLFNENLRFSEELYFFNNIVYHGTCILLLNFVAEPITDKNRWGDSGLSGNLLKMEKGELFTIRTAYAMNYISMSRFIFAFTFSIAKFCRRVLISTSRRFSIRSKNKCIK